MPSYSMGVSVDGIIVADRDRRRSATMSPWTP
jgi:hypothetical protein